MSTNDLFVAVGAHLRAARENTGQTVDYVADALRIKPGYLADLESGNLDDMPGRPYILGFLRSYSDYLGLDTESLVYEVRNVLDSRQPAVETERPVGKQVDRGARAPLIAASIMIAVVGLGGWSYWRSLSDDEAANLAQIPLDWLQQNESVQSQSNDTPDLTPLAETDSDIAPSQTASATSRSSLPVAEEIENTDNTEVVDVLPPLDETEDDITEQATRDLIARAGGDEQNDPNTSLREEVGTVSTQTTALLEETDAVRATDRVVDEELARLDRALEAADAILKQAGDLGGARSASEDVVAGQDNIVDDENDPIELTNAEELVATLTEDLEAGSPISSATPTTSNPSEVFAAQVEGGEPTNRVQLFAEADSWVEVRSDDRSYSRQQLMRSGETLLLPDDQVLTLKTGNAGGLVIILDGKRLPVLGESGEVVRNVSLTPDALQERLTSN